VRAGLDEAGERLRDHRRQREREGGHQVLLRGRTLQRLPGNGGRDRRGLVGHGTLHVLRQSVLKMALREYEYLESMQ